MSYQPVVESFEKDGFVAEIVHDDSPPSDPLGDPVGTIAYNSSRYTLGTQNVPRERLDSIKQEIESGELIGMPVFAYVHSGVQIVAAEANPFHCPWDSGQSGFVYCLPEKALEEWGTDEERAAAKLAADVGTEWVPSERLCKQACEYMAGEVKTYSQYLNGECYQILVCNPEGDLVNSCCGYIGLDDYIRSEAKSMLDSEVRRARKAKRKERRERQHWEARGMVTA